MAQGVEAHPNASICAAHVDCIAGGVARVGCRRGHSPRNISVEGRINCGLRPERSPLIHVWCNREAGSRETVSECASCANQSCVFGESLQAERTRDVSLDGSALPEIPLSAPAYEGTRFFLARSNLVHSRSFLRNERPERQEEKQNPEDPNCRRLMTPQVSPTRFKRTCPSVLLFSRATQVISVAAGCIIANTNLRSEFFENVRWDFRESACDCSRH